MLQQFGRRHQLGEHDDAEDQQRNQGKQRVVGDGAGQQETPVGLEVLQHPQREGERVGENLDGGRMRVSRHFSVGFELSPVRRQFGNRIPEPTTRTTLAATFSSLPSCLSSKVNCRSLRVSSDMVGSVYCAPIACWLITSRGNGSATTGAP